MWIHIPDFNNNVQQDGISPTKTLTLRDLIVIELELASWEGENYEPRSWTATQNEALDRVKPTLIFGLGIGVLYSAHAIPVSFAFLGLPNDPGFAKDGALR
ncbi:hypothetical protein N7488_008847 [Penicillium malachiteum]|nr:hypothetical protein N7488_008847 [Penicillium malachiteum]